MTHSLKTHIPHTDAFGKPIVIGDILMGARGKKSHYQDTQYSFVLVIGLTKGMLRVQQIGHHPDCLNLSKQELLEGIEQRGRRGGASAGLNFINLDRSTGITQAEIDTNITKGRTIHSGFNLSFS
jgi:hypothetical protein